MALRGMTKLRKNTQSDKAPGDTQGDVSKGTPEGLMVLGGDTQGDKAQGQHTG